MVCGHIMLIVIIDLELGNLYNIASAFRFMGANRTLVDTSSQETTAVEKGLAESANTEPDTGPAELSVPDSRKETDSGTDRPNASKKP